jgi:D-3-phosphoglycerate dehydrogenase
MDKATRTGAAWTRESQRKGRYIKILIADVIAPTGVELLRQSANVIYKPNITAETLKATIAQYDGLIVRSRTRVTAELIHSAKKLRVIGRVGVGLDTIDVKTARSRGIIVLNTPLASTVAVAELTLGLMLALARAIPTANTHMKQGAWLKKQLMGSELSGKTLGGIGLGRIGTSVTERAKVFGMRVIAVDPYLTSGCIRQRGAEPVDMDSLLAEADYLTIHVPLTDDTRAMLGPAEIDRMKDGACLICCARGSIVDENALVEALDSGKLAGAALDVFATEPPGSTRLVQHPKVIATPHIGAMTREAQEKAALDIARQVLNIFNLPATPTSTLNIANFLNQPSA